MMQLMRLNTWILCFLIFQFSLLSYPRQVAINQICNKLSCLLCFINLKDTNKTYDNDCIRLLSSICPTLLLWIRSYMMFGSIKCCFLLRHDKYFLWIYMDFIGFANSEMKKKAGNRRDFKDLYYCERCRQDSSDRPTGMKIRNQSSKTGTLRKVQPAAR